jgi:hypothetical protein
MLLLAGSGLAQNSAPVPAAPPSHDLRFAQALLAYENNHWPQAFATLSQLGDEGHAESARMALQMWRYGRALYGVSFSASAAQVDYWGQIWGCGGDATGRECRVALQTPLMPLTPRPTR